MSLVVGGRTMDTEILKQPRGFLRVLQWFIAMLAFATCANYSSYLEFKIVCSDKEKDEHMVKQAFQYPFKLDSMEPLQFETLCGSHNASKIYFPGDFSSDAQFFVFTGVTTWLYCFLSIAVYVFFTNLYTDEQKNVPMIDFCVTVIIAVFWLAGSSAWANSLNGLKNEAKPSNWFDSKAGGPCQKSEVGNQIWQYIDHCEDMFAGSFGGANISVIFGFLSFFLWACNLWYLYKETGWFTKPGPVPGQPHINVESPSSLGSN